MMDNPLRRPEEILAFRTLREIFAPRPRQVWSVGPTDSVFTALQIMSDKDIGFLPVFECHGLVGVLSERDCARKAVLRRKPLESTPVADIMVRDVVTVELIATFADCLRLMHRHGVRHLPAVEMGKVSAVVSIRDLLSEAVAHQTKIVSELERKRLTIVTSTA
jgi:CBS domain-containing protein